MIEYNFFPELAKVGRSPYALQLDNLVKDIMGPESKKSKNLLLLQLAANLMTNRTDQPGFKGFLDVLGQAGQQVIPMAMALETQRRKDDLELKKRQEILTESFQKYLIRMAEISSCISVDPRNSKSST